MKFQICHSVLAVAFSTAGVLRAAASAHALDSTKSLKSTREVTTKQDNFSSFAEDKHNADPYAFVPIEDLSKLVANRKENEVRDLQRVECGGKMSLYSPDIIRLYSYNSFKAINATGLEEAGTILTEIFPNIEFAVEVRKICASCQSESLDNLDPYCGPSAYGYDVLHSGYVFLPVTINDDGSTSIINAKKLQTWTTFRPISRSHVDSVFYNTDLSLTIFNILAASQGLVAMNFDMTGYGESSSLVPSPFVRLSVGTATLPIYHKVRSMIVEETGGKTKLNDRVSFYGYSEGGYNSIAAADAFAKSGMKVEHVYAGGSGIKTSSWLIMGLFRSMNENKTTIFHFLNAALVGLPASSTRPGVANYMEGQDALAGNITVWLEMYTDDNSPESRNYEASLKYNLENYGEVLSLTNYFSDTLTELFSNALDSNDTNPCASAIPGVNDKLCEALVDQDLTEIVLNADYDIDLCHAGNDTLVVIENIPEGFPIKHLIMNADHYDAGTPCLVKMFSSAEFEKPKMRKTKSWKSSKGSKGSKSAKSSKDRK